MFWLTLILEFVPPIGSHPRTWERYEKSIDYKAGIFTCFDGVTQIPLSKINDDFVDCQDGSDEPGTSANSNGTFYCQNAGYIPQEIPKWSIGDSICDCCDGSDEILNKHIKCPNTCEKMQIERMELYSILFNGFSSGLKIKEARLKSGKAKLEDSRDKKKKLEQKISDLEEARTRVKIARPAATPVPEVTPMAYDEPNNTPSPTFEIDPICELNNEIERVKDMIAQYADEQMEGNQDENILKELENLKARLSELESEKTSRESMKTKDESEVNSDTNEISDEYSEESEGINENGEFIDETPISIDESITTEPTTLEIVNDNETNITIDSIPIENVEHDWKYWIRIIWKYTFRVPEIRSSLEDTIRQKTLDSIENQLNSARDEMRKIEDIANLDKNTNPEDIVIMKSSYKMGDIEFEYLKEIKQKYNSYGNYKSTENDVMHFDGGQYCWQTQCGKKTDITKVCWKEDKLIQLQEVSTCVYKGIFATPNACSVEKIEVLKNMTLDELENISKQIGIN